MSHNAILGEKKSLSTLMTQRRAALGIFLLAAAVYLFPLAYNHFRAPFFAPGPGSDTIPTALVPMSLLRDGSFYLDNYADYFDEIADNWGIDDTPYFVASIDNHLVSDYPILAGVLALPFAGAALGTQAITTSPTDALYAARFAAALITALTVAVFFLTCLELTDLRTSVLVSLAFAFGTSIWSTQSQGLWQHTPSVLLQSIAFLLLLRGRSNDSKSVAPAGLFLSAAVVARPNDGVIAVLFAAYVWLEYRKAFPAFLMWAALPILLAVVYNASANGNPFLFGFEATKPNQWAIPSLSSVAGLLFSPSRGIFFFSPFLALAPVGLWLARSDPHYRFFVCAGLATVVFYSVLSLWRQWYGGWDYGPRLLSDILPLISLMIVPVVARLRGAGLVLFSAAVVYGAFIQSMGLWDYGVQWHYAHQQDPNLFWTLTGSEPLFYLQKFMAMANR